MLKFLTLSFCQNIIDEKIFTFILSSIYLLSLSAGANAGGMSDKDDAANIKVRCLVDVPGESKPIPLKHAFIWFRSEDDLDRQQKMKKNADTPAQSLVVISPGSLPVPRLLLRPGSILKIHNSTDGPLNPKLDSNYNIGFSEVIAPGGDSSFQFVVEEFRPILISHKGKEIAYVFISANPTVTITNSDGVATLNSVERVKGKLLSWLPPNHSMRVNVDMGDGANAKDEISVQFRHK